MKRARLLPLAVAMTGLVCGAAACWSQDNPYDPQRCRPPCVRGVAVCVRGVCVALDASAPKSDARRDGGADALGRDGAVDAKADAKPRDSRPPDAPVVDAPGDAPGPDAASPDAAQDATRDVGRDVGPDGPTPCTTDGGAAGIVCKSKCIDPLEDTLNCNGCGNLCPSNNRCAAGQCKPEPCLGGFNAWQCMPGIVVGCKATCGSYTIECGAGGSACTCSRGGARKSCQFIASTLSCTACQQSFSSACCHSL